MKAKKQKAIYLAIAATTIDGKIAKDSRHMSDWTSKEDKDFLHEMLDTCDVVIIGNNTYKTAVKPLSKRNCIVFSRSVNQPIRKSEKLMYLNPEKSNIKTFIKNAGYKKIAILGGAQTYTYFLENNLLDEIYLTIEPIVFGGGINLFASKQTNDYHFKLNSAKKLNKKGSLLLLYKRV